jgi:hypothetical protein
MGKINGENLWGKFMGKIMWKIYGENLWGKFMGKINGTFHYCKIIEKFSH